MVTFLFTRAAIATLRIESTVVFELLHGLCLLSLRCWDCGDRLSARIQVAESAGCEGWPFREWRFERQQIWW